MLGRLAPTCLISARSSRESEELFAHGARDKAQRIERAGAGRPAPFRPPGSPPPFVSRHHQKGAPAPVELRRRPSPWHVCHYGRPAGLGHVCHRGRPAGLASARRYKTRRRRRSSTHHMLRSACSSLIKSISSPFLEFLCLIKLFCANQVEDSSTRSTKIQIKFSCT